MLKEGIAAAYLSVNAFEAHDFDAIAALVADWLAANPRRIVHDISFHSRGDMACATVVFRDTNPQNR